MPPATWDRTLLPIPLAWLRAGHTGVTLFFVLSAFLLALPLFDDAGRRRWSAREYFLRRALRIVPVYWLAVAVGTLASATAAHDLLRGLPYLTFLQAVHGWFTPLEPYSTVWWTLATEVEFYLCLPLLALALASRGGRRAGIVGLAVYAVAYGAFVAGRLHMATLGGQVHLVVSAFGFGPVFLCGIAAAAWYGRHGDALRARLVTSRLARRGGADVAFVALLLALGVLLRWAAYHGWNRTSAPPRILWHVPEAILWSGVMLLLLVAPCRAKAVFCNRALRALGVLSYSIYLWHYPILVRSIGSAAFTGWSAGSAARIATIAAATVAASALSYRLVERPFLIRKAGLDS